MGIYYDGNIYGIAWEQRNENYNIIKSYEKQYNEKLTFENINEIKAIYDKLTEIEKSTINFYVFTKCISTYEINSQPSITRYFFTRLRLEQFFINGYDENIC